MGQCIVQYTIEEKISESNFTSVYRAFDIALRRRILLKVLHKHHTDDNDLKQRFIREARACAALRSENIVQIYELTEIDGAPAIVMEYIDGRSLKTLIAEEQTRTFALAKNVALQVLRGLSVAHEQGIIHRDIKPGNILVANDGTIKITDFGLASVALAPTLTVQGTVLGTPAYMSPEQIRREHLDQRTDLFSLGVTLVEVLTGKRIFEGDSYADCVKKIISFKVDKLDELTEKSSFEFTQFLKPLMAPQKEKRFASSQEALSVLSKEASDIIISPVNIPTQRRGWAWAFGAITLAAITLVSLFYFSRPSTQNTTTSAPATPAGETVQQPFSRIKLNTASPIQSDRSKEPHPSFHKETAPSPGKEMPPDSGTIAITSLPWAKVFIDSQSIGETPLGKSLTLPAGKHTIVFTHPSFEPIVRAITIEPHKEITVVGNFLETAGYLICVATPWAEVYVDEQYKDTTPMGKPIVLSPGKHRVRFQNASFTDIVREITIAANDTATLCISFHK